MKDATEDTHPEIQHRQIEGIRRMSPAEKLRRIDDLNRTLEQLTLAEVRRKHPDASDLECKLRVASRRLPAELLLKAFGWDVRREGY